LLFDLRDDPAEAAALDTSKASKYAAVVAEMAAMRRALLDDIGSTARSVADYSQGPAGRAANCCNAKHVTCRCSD
jgi:hypothetical protein